VEDGWKAVDAEADVIRIAATRYVRDWWSGVGAFQSYDELAIDSGIEDKFKEEIEMALVRLLIQDYWTGKVLHEEEIRKRLLETFEEVAEVEIGLQSSDKRLDSDFEKAGQFTQGYTLSEMPQVKPGIEISAAPRVVMERDKSGREIPRIESYGLRAIINASPSEAHPGPFRVSWEMNPPGQGSSRMTRPGSESKLETAADRVEVAAVLLDAEGRTMERVTLTLPVRKERVEEKQEEDRLDRPAPTQSDKAKVRSADCGPLRDQYFKRCKKMADEHIRKNCMPIYSGCAMDVAGCLNAYINDALPDDYCAQPGYIGCATGQLDAFLGCLQRCNDDLLARKINTYGITPCRLSCQEKVAAGIKACKAGRIPPPSSGSDQQVVSAQQPKAGPDGPSAPPPATEPPPAHDREAASTPAEREQVSGEFGASLDKRWKVVSPNQESSVRLTNNGALRMTAAARQGGSDFSPGPNNNAPRILQPVSGDWTLETRIHFAPTAYFQGAGILVCFDARPESANGWRVIERQFYGGRQIVNFSGAQKDFTGSTTYLRVRKKGTNYTAWYSADGRIWTEAGTRKELRVPTHAGVMTTRQPWDRNLNLDSAAVYDYVRIIRE
jgi:hypothetical protein